MGVLDTLKGIVGKKDKMTDPDQIQPGELSQAGVEIKPGDRRLKQGVTYSNLSPDEKRKVDNVRNKNK